MWTANDMRNVLQNEDEHRVLGNADTKYDMLIIHIWLRNNRQNEITTTGHAYLFINISDIT